MSDRSPFADGLGPPGARYGQATQHRPGQSLTCQVLLGEHPVDGCHVLDLSAERLILSVPGPAVLPDPRLFLPGRSLLVVLSSTATRHRHTARLQVVYSAGPGTGPFRVEARFAYPVTADELRLLLW